jgi:peptidoglycan/LPS O-acetylase OafA/YrhL
MMGSIQALRAIAAISVCICHAEYFQIVHSGKSYTANALEPLASGVDLFFVISGFVIVHSSDNLFGQPGARSEFLIRRIARIVPPYWAATLILIPATLTPPDFTSVLQSLLFIPYVNTSGSMNPVHGVGWTLNFEMLFYVVFAICIAWPRRIAVPVVTGAFVAAVALRYYFDPSIVPVQFWSDPIILEFVFGMWIAILYGRIEIPSSARMLIIAVALLVIWMSRIGSGMPTGYRFLLWGIPAAAIVAATVWTPQRLISPLLETLGDASYLIYLLHPLVYGAVLKTFGADTQSIGAALILSVAISVLISQTIEKPVTRWTRRRLEQLWRHKRISMRENDSRMLDPTSHDARALGCSAFGPRCRPQNSCNRLL